MKLVSVNIKNFRSIKDVEISFSDSKCRILVGINEAGKSNILKALSLLADDEELGTSDVREPLPEESESIEAYVRFKFELENEKKETAKQFSKISSTILAATANRNIISGGRVDMSIKNFCSLLSGELYKFVDINTGERRFEGQIFDKGNLHVVDGWMKPSESCPQDFEVSLNGQIHNLSKHKLVYIYDFANDPIPAEYLEAANVSDIIAAAISLPQVLFWKYDEADLLPNSLEINEFASNPDICPPLKNMFYLAGTKDISSELDKKTTPNQLQSYLDRIARKTTTHFQNVWAEYKDVEFSLTANGDKIVPGVREKNVHDFARRSDGFKRFVTFLLTVSMSLKTKNTSNTLLLVDEPDTSLHPSGARCLRDELIKISQKNYVVYGTHSIFMIDSDNIGHHYIVEKKDEITSVEQAKESIIYDEEVLYKALGYSAFANLREYNIIFEGWRDKALFRTALKGSNKELKEKYEATNVCHAEGVKSIRPVASIVELVGKSCIIVSDCDKPALNAQKEYRKIKGFGEWKTYKDIDSTIDVETAEDFIDNVFIAKQINAAISGKGWPKFKESTLPEKRGKLQKIQTWLTDQGMETTKAKKTLNDIKEAIFNELEYEHIVHDEYIKILEGILS